MNKKKRQENLLARKLDFMVGYRECNVMYIIGLSFQVKYGKQKIKIINDYVFLRMASFFLK